MFKVQALQSHYDHERKLVKVYDAGGNELSLYVKPNGNMEMRYFKANGDSFEVFRGDWSEGELTLYQPYGEDLNEIWG